MSLLRKKYLSSAVNVLTNSPNIFHITKRDLFQLSCFKFMNNCGNCGKSSVLKSVSDRLSCDLLSVLLKRGLLHIYLTTFFAVCKFQNTSAMSVIFFSKSLKSNLSCKNAEQEAEKALCFLDNCICINCIKIVPIKKRILVIGKQCVNK